MCPLAYEYFMNVVGFDVQDSSSYESVEDENGARGEDEDPGENEPKKKKKPKKKKTLEEQEANCN